MDTGNDDEITVTGKAGKTTFIIGGKPEDVAGMIDRMEDILGPVTYLNTAKVAE